MYNSGMSDDWKQQLEIEFSRAAQARTKNNEGQARVCARRACGVAIREYFLRKGIQPPKGSAYDLLIHLRDGKTPLPPDLKLAANHLTTRVTEEFSLPVDADLLAEARKLCKWLLPDWE